MLSHTLDGIEQRPSEQEFFASFGVAILAEFEEQTNIFNEMKSKTKMVITIAASQKTIFYRGSQPIVAWCEQCAAETRMITADAAARLFGTSSRSIYRQVENGGLHFAETDGNSLVICSRSLLIENNKHLFGKEHDHEINE